MRTEPVQLPLGQPVTEAYIKRSHPGVEALFGSHPAEDEHWHRRLNWLGANAAKRVKSDQLADALLKYNNGMNGQSAVLANINAIRAGAPVIVTGQQAGLWTGPLLVIHKAVTVIAAAKDAAQMLGTPVVPVFWIAGEDHDWDEVNHAYVRNGEREMVRMAIQRPKGPRSSVTRTKLQPEVLAEAHKQLSDVLHDTSFKPELLEHLAHAAKHADSLSQLFASVMAWLFGKQGLVLLDSDDAGIRALEAPMFAQIIRRNDELEAAYAKSAAALQELGYPVTADVTAGNANLFLFEAGERTLLQKKDGRFVDRKQTVSRSAEELLDIAANEPQLLSNNVLTRPLMQDYLFPVLGAVLGSGEIAYWSLTGEAFRCLGMEMPLIIPRMSYSLVEQTTEKYMAKYELTFSDVIHRFEDRRAGWLKERDELDIEGRFFAARAEFMTMYQPIMDMSASVEKGLQDLAANNLRRIQEQISFLETKTKDAHARRFQAALRQLDDIAQSLWPEGKPQERVLNMTDFWNRYGSAWLEKLLNAPYHRTGGHYLVYL
ncbi:bacillithiol biosynthesis cysteine-adding enzyme BshC [Paenibacillus sp. R14(2021)]|uniref:bacillithiol biosynthesis cysteine-adding enzyme BshC n=1 Tax=Paenibacillus sp. R14(2021) TaxID=2859228 RepID=UPI001C611C3B|nr:bacillithiol biosynthesis cysteine-adding enzyme BshC [Paenibacillus sp. R14(2021)]